MSELSKREQTLVSLGAAIASNCVPCIEFHIPGARKAGLSEIQIKEALQVADKVRRVPARMVLQTALARIGGSPDGSEEATGGGCCRDESSRDTGPECR
jgi:4-carboxymuconolactone decarboxylase